MSASDDQQQSPLNRIVLSRKDLQFSAAQKLAAMDPKDRDLLVRLERARRGLPIARTGGPRPGLADLIAAIPDDQVAAVARHAGITVGDWQPPVLRTSLLLRHEDKVRAALAAAAAWVTPYPPAPPEEWHAGGTHRNSTYRPPLPYRTSPPVPIDPTTEPPRDEPTDPVTAYRLGAQLLLELTRPEGQETEGPGQT